MPRWIVLPFLVLPFAIVSCRVTSTRPDEAVPAATTAPVVSAAPEAAARDWLALVDRGQWEAAYEVMIPMFREAVSLAEWRATVLQARPQNAGQGERVLVSSASGTDMFADAVQLTFRTGSALETVTLLSRDSRWLVVGYIFPAVGGSGSAGGTSRSSRFATDHATHACRGHRRGQCQELRDVAVTVPARGSFAGQAHRRFPAWQL